MTLKTYALLMKAQAIIDAENTAKHLYTLLEGGVADAEKHKSKSKSDSR